LDSRKIGAIIPLLLLTFPSFAQSFSTLSGARSHGLAYASACLEDEWSLFNNVAGLAGASTLAASISSNVKSQLPGANRIAATLTAPFKVGVVALGTICTGDNLYNEQILSAGFSNKLGIASLGIKTNYIQYNAEGFGRKGVATISLGGIFSITKKIKIGAHIVNINQPLISTQDNERLPTTLIVGASFLTSEHILIVTELEKNLDHETTWKTGIEYNPLKKFAIRSGFNLYPNSFFFGTGFNTKKLKVNYAIQYSTAMSTCHEASVSYFFSR
jgi:hypothetical protein